MTMVLTVAVPVRMAVEMRVGRRTRVTSIVDDVSFVTSVRRLRRIQHIGGSLDPDRVIVEAFIPEHQRGGIEASKGGWLSDEYLRCYARLSPEPQEPFAVFRVRRVGALCGRNMTPAKTQTRKATLMKEKL